MDDDLLTALDVTVVEVDGLRSRGCWVRNERVLLIRGGLPDDEEKESIIDWAMQVACRATA
jgi:hypothetical protein